MVDLVGIGLEIRTRGLRQGLRELDNLKRTGTDVERGFSRVSSAARAMGATIAAALGGITITSTVKQIAAFEDAMLGLQAVSGATAQQMETLSRQARLLGATSMHSATQAGEAQRFLAQAGFDVNETLSATPGILNLATAAQLDLGQAADYASNILGGFRLEVGELGRVNDVLAATAASSNTNVSQLADALSYAAPIAANAGISIEETASAIGVLSDAGLQSTRAGTGLLGFIRQVSNLTPAATAALGKYGITAQDVNVETRGLSNVLGTLRKANISTADSFAIFGSEAGPAAQILANGSERVNELTGELGEADGAAARMAQTLGSGLTGSMRGFLSMSQETILALGDSGLSGGFQSVVDTATGVLAVYNDMLPEFAEARGLSDEQAASLETLANVLKGAGAAVGGATTAVIAYRTAMWAAAAAQTAFNTAVRANPIGLALTALVAAGSAVYAYREELGLTAEQYGLTAEQARSFRNEIDGMSNDDMSGALDSLNAELEEATLKAAAAREELANLRSEQAGGSGVLGFSAGTVGREVRGMQALGEAEDRIREIEQRRSIILEEKNRRQEESASTANEMVITAERVTRATNDNTKADKEALKSLRELDRQQQQFASNLQGLEDRIDPAAAAQRRFTQEQILLQTALMNGSITMERYLDLYQKLQDAQLSTQPPSQAYGQGFGGEIASRGTVGQPNAAPGMGIADKQGEMSDLDRWMQNAETNFANFGNLAASTAQTFSQSFGTAFTDVISGQTSMTEGFRSLAQTILTSVISALASMAAQWAALQIAQMAMGQSAAAASVAQAAATGPAIAAAYTPAATMVSLASFGANAPAATAGIASTMAAAQGLALTGMAHDGISNIPQEGTWLLNKGERVLNPQQNADLTSFLAQGGNRQQANGGGVPSITINNIEDSRRAGTAQSRQNQDGGITVDNFVYDMRNDGPMAQTITKTFGVQRKGR